VKPYKPADFQALTAHELHEIDEKVEEELDRVNFVDWAVGLLTTGMLWALYEKLKKPVYKNLDALSEVKLRADHAYGRVKPIGSLAAVENLTDVVPFNRISKNMLTFALRSAAENVQQISDKTRTSLRMMLVRAKIQGTHPRELASQMRLAFQGLNRDWRRIAVTESASIATNGYLMAQGEGQQIVGQSAADCCPWCRRMIHGKVFTVTQNADTAKNPGMWQTHIWPGKNNVGRSRHLRSRAGVARPAALLWVPCIPLHPFCRCRFVAINPKFQEVDAEGFVRVR
jgi:hypothetical protein